MIEMLFNLVEELFWKVFKGVNCVTGVAVVGNNSHDFVVNFAIVNKFHNAENFGGSVDAGSKRLVGDKKYIKFVAIFVEGLRNETIIAGFSINDGFDAVKHKTGIFAVPFNFMI